MGHTGMHDSLLSTEKNYLSNLAENLPFLCVFREKNVQNTHKRTDFLLNLTDHFFLCRALAHRSTYRTYRFAKNGVYNLLESRLS